MVKIGIAIGRVDFLMYNAFYFWISQKYKIINNSNIW